MGSVHFERVQANYRNEKRRERERRRQWGEFILTEGPRYVVVNWISGGKCGIALNIELETDRLDLAISKRKIAAASHLPKNRSSSVLIYDRIDKSRVYLVGGVPRVIKCRFLATRAEHQCVPRRDELTKERPCNGDVETG